MSESVSNKIMAVQSLLSMRVVNSGHRPHMTLTCVAIILEFDLTSTQLRKTV